MRILCFPSLVLAVSTWPWIQDSDREETHKHGAELAVFTLAEAGLVEQEEGSNRTRPEAQTTAGKEG